MRTLNLKVFRGSKADTTTPTTPIDTSARVNGEVDGSSKGGEEGGDRPSPLTTPLSTLGDAVPLSLVSNGPSRSHDNSPTPDIIKVSGGMGWWEGCGLKVLGVNTGSCVLVVVMEEELESNSEDAGNISSRDGNCSSNADL